MDARFRGSEEPCPDPSTRSPKCEYSSETPSICDPSASAPGGDPGDVEEALDERAEASCLVG